MNVPNMKIDALTGLFVAVDFSESCFPAALWDEEREILGINSKKAPTASRWLLFLCEGGIINQKRGLCEKEGRKEEIKR